MTATTAGADRRWTRRRFLAAGTATAAAAGAGTAAAVTRGGSAAGPGPNPGGGDATVAFHGRHQAGITTPPQARLQLAAFDVTTERRHELVDLLRAWTSAAAQMTAGREVGATGATGGPALAPPDDTGEALDLAPSRLTITVGFGPGLFGARRGTDDRFGLAARRPAALQPLPHFPGDDLDPARSGGDLCLQVCADEAQIAFHAVRNLARIGFGAVTPRWSQLGFGQAAGATPSGTTPRNLMGFKDGTANLGAGRPDLLDEYVWVGPDDDPGAGWLAGGTYLVARRIAMHIETWDRSSRAEQEAVFGRDKRHGAPLSGGTETTVPDFEVTGSDGAPLIPLDAHVRLAHPDTNGGSRLLRRGYNFADGTDALGRLDGGLFFVAFTRDPHRHFVPIQSRLAGGDALNEYIKVTGSALFAVPPGVTGPGGHWGEALLAP
ncbi:MAG: iron uptake transporter deferrochelatase/peroxidase subunit [Acidimicrobiales bacterium]